MQKVFFESIKKVNIEIAIIKFEEKRRERKRFRDVAMMTLIDL